MWSQPLQFRNIVQPTIRLDGTDLYLQWLILYLDCECEYFGGLLLSLIYYFCVHILIMDKQWENIII